MAGMTGDAGEEPIRAFERARAAGDAEAMAAAALRLAADRRFGAPLVGPGYLHEAYRLASGASAVRLAVELARCWAYAGEPEQAAPFAAEAVAAAEQAFQSWQWIPAEERANVLLRAAGIMRRRRHEISATMVYEVGKSWPEADGDTAEAIDFCEFYAREMIRWGGPQPLTPNPGESNEYRYISLGVGAVIPPWNFPFAITCSTT